MNQRKIGTILSYVQIIVSNTISLIYTPYMLRMMGQSEYVCVESTEEVYEVRTTAMNGENH